MAFLVRKTRREHKKEFLTLFYSEKKSAKVVLKGEMLVKSGVILLLILVLFL